MSLTTLVLAIVVVSCVGGLLRLPFLMRATHLRGYDVGMTYVCLLAGIMSLVVGFQSFGVHPLTSTIGFTAAPLFGSYLLYYYKITEVPLDRS